MRNRAVKGWRFPMVLILGAIVAGMTLMAASAPAGEKQTSRIYRTVIENPSVRDSDGQAHLQEVKTGVLAKRGKERCLAKWGLTADYLNRQIPGYSFEIVPLAYDEVYPAVEKKKVDFILANPFFYVELEKLQGASRIATLKNRRLDGVFTIVGGVIFRRAGRADIQELDDLKGKSFMAVKEIALGGWYAAWRELKERAIDPHRDFRDLSFGGTHDAVVYAVRDGKVDAGTVRTDTLERMAAEGKIRLEDFHVLEHDHISEEVCEFPFLHSTDMYPEWPMAKVPHTSDELAEKVAVALITMPADCPAAKAASCAGWTIPLSYEPVHECLRELKIGPYKDLGKITVADVMRNYWPWILVFSCLFLVMAVAVLVILKLNRKINASHMALEAEVEERKRAQEELRESEEGFRTICESAQDALIRIDHDGNISLWNNAAQEMFGYSHEEAMGQNMHELVAPESLLEDHRKAFPAFQRTGTGAAVAKTIELSAVRKNGEEFPVELSLSAVKVKGKWHAVGIVRDITERKQVEEELQKAKEAAEAANQAKSEFLANMSHEIRTPMNGVIGMTEILLDTELSSEQREYAEIVRNSGDALLAVINDILDYSKIEAGQLDMETIDFDLRVTVEDATDVLAMTAHKKGLELACLINQDVPALMRGDPGRLRQVLINLSNNAIKFTEKGEVVIRADLEEEDDTRATVRFSISDTGIGIPRDRMDRLFKSFSQVDSSTSREYGGTGLGLAISKELAEMMGGKIGVESPSTSLRTGEEGKGSTFWFTAIFEKQPEGSETKIVVPEDIRGQHILVVDDNATNRLVVKEQLRSWGCSFDEASGGAEALDKLRQAVAKGDPFDIAIIDMQMPGMDGDALGRNIKEDPDLMSVSMVMLASVGERGEAARMKEIGFAAYLTKPVKQSQLYDCLTTVAGMQRVATGKPSAPIVTRHSIAEDRKRNIRILIAEDNAINQKVALHILERLGYRADAVANGHEAVKALEAVPYDLVLMDVQMPEMDGFEATKEIRKKEEQLKAESSFSRRSHSGLSARLRAGAYGGEPGGCGPQAGEVGKLKAEDGTALSAFSFQPSARSERIPIVAMTAHAMKGDKERCLEAGMDDYTTKPIDPTDLLEKIRTWTERRNKALDTAEGEKENGDQTEKTEQGAPVNLDKALERALGDKDFLENMLEQFTTTLPAQIEALRTALEQGNRETLQQEAHHLKGSAANLSIDEMAAAAFELEQMGREGNLEAGGKALGELENEVVRLEAYVNEIDWSLVE